MADYAGKQVLISGGAGAIGSTLAKRLMELGAHVTVLDNFSVGREWALPVNVAAIRGSVTDPEALETAFSYRPQVVVHLAARYGNLQSIETPETDLHVNGLGTLRVLQWAERAGSVERFLFASSGCSIYGHDAPLPLREDQPPAMTFMSPYQVHKMLGELYSEYFRVRGVPTVRLRFFSSFGPGEIPGRFRGVVPNFLWRALHKEPLTITGTGQESRTFTFVEDLVGGILAAGLAEGIDGEAFNLAGGQERTINDLARIVNVVADNTKAGIVYADRRPWDRIVTQSVSIRKAHDRLGYNPTTMLEDGIEKTAVWFRENWDRIQEEARW